MVLLSMLVWTLVVGFVGLLFMTLRHVTFWRFKGIPYIDTMPIIGIFGSVFMRAKSFPKMVEDCYNACPGAKYFGLLDFNRPVLLVKDPEILKEIGVKSFDYFPNHHSFVEEEFDPILSKNIFSLRDDRWREMRMTLSPTFTASKMKYMFQLVSKCSTDFVQYLTEHPEITREMDLKDVYTRYTNDVIATAAFGISVNSMKDRQNDFYVHGKDASSFDGWFKIFKFVTARMFPRSMRFLGFTFLSGKTQDFFMSLVHDTVKTRDEKRIVRPDLMHLLMQARDNEKGIAMTTEDIIAQAFIFFLAGFDTSSQLMCFISHLLAHHTDVQDRLREEVDSVLDEVADDVTYEAMSKMKYMDMVLSESLRLYPPSPITDRVCIKSYELPPSTVNGEKITVTPDWTIWVPIYGLHRDPNYFPEPEKFDPERFSDDNKNDIKPYTYMPFGFGPRKCIGERFAIMETKLLMAQILRSFVLKPSEKVGKNFEYTKTSFTVGPKNGFWIKLEARKDR